MSGVSICRSTQLVAIDAHPANNSLVITYEILVVAEDESSGLELGRRNKRDQFQISVLTFDNLNEISRPLNFGKLAEEILAKCPILADANQADTLEDIQLNLLYLFNRKQAQLSQPARLSSSASTRNRSAKSSVVKGARGVMPAARTKDPIGQKPTNLVESPLEIYQLYREKELQLIKRQDGSDYKQIEQFVSHLDEHLLECETDLGLGGSIKLENLPNIETQLEDLYGEMEERRRSVATLRHLVRDDDAKLISIASNRLMIYALLRLLRDCGARDLPISESILYCLIRFTSFEDVFNAMPFGQTQASNSDNESLDLVRVIIDLTSEHIMSLTANSDQNVKLIANKSYYTNSLLLVLANLIHLDRADPSHNLKRRLIQQQNGLKLADILADSLVLFAKHLPRDIRSSMKIHERITWTLMELFDIGLQLSTLKPFVQLIRAAPRIQKIVDSLLAILNCLQLSRPGSGSSQFQQVLANDEETLLMVYELEIELMLMINDLIQNSKFRTRFARKQLTLKCVLRSLVVFLASSRQLNSLSSFNQSLALVAPLRCLYQLSSSESIRKELFESRVIMRCLLEYLLLASSDLRAEIESNWQDVEWSRNDGDANRPKRGQVLGADLRLTNGDQIALSSLDAHRCIVCLWINLAAQPEASMYKQDSNKRDEDADRLIASYIKSSTGNLESFTKLVVVANQKQIRKHLKRSLTNSHLMIYLHMKLIRNLSENLKQTCFEPSLDQFIASLLPLVELSKRHQSDTFVPLLVESLAVLANITDTTTLDKQAELPTRLAPLMSELFAGDCSLIDCTSSSNSDVENDDLLLISINLLSKLAIRYEICPQLELHSTSIIEVIDSILEHRALDTQLLISAVFCFNQLLRHATFLLQFGSSLEALPLDENQDQQRNPAASHLLDRLCSLVQHPDSSVVKLVGQILDKLKQFEESQSLADSVTYKRRFTSYNQKWLQAIKTNREDPPDEPISIDELREQFKLAGLTGSAVTSALDAEQSKFEEYNQLRTITADSSARTSSRLTSTSSMSRCDSRSVSSKRAGNQRSRRENGDDEDEEDEDDDDDEEDEDTFSEPDVNVIDSMSTIGHLRGRQTLLNNLPTGSDLMRQT